MSRCLQRGRAAGAFAPLDSLQGEGPRGVLGRLGGILGRLGGSVGRLGGNLARLGGGLGASGAVFGASGARPGCVSGTPGRGVQGRPPRLRAMDPRAGNFVLGPFQG